MMKSAILEPYCALAFLDGYDVLGRNLQSALLDTLLMSSHTYAHDKGSVLDRFMTKLFGSFVTIFTIHRPTPISGAYNGLDEKLLEKCLGYAKDRGYQFLSIDQIVADAAQGVQYKQPTICFTLDDGYSDQANRLLPLLLAERASPTLFVITDFIDQQLWPWDAKLTYLIWNTPLQSLHLVIGAQTLLFDLSSTNKRVAARREAIQAVKLLDPSLHAATILNIAKACQVSIPELPPIEFEPVSWQVLRGLETQGLRVGSHSQSHLIFNSATEATISSELEYSKQRLSAELKNPSSVFCYPLGTRKDFSVNHIELVKAAGFNSAISTISNVTTLRSIQQSPFQIQRIAFPSTFEKFVRYTSWKEALRSKLPF